MKLSEVKGKLPFSKYIKKNILPSDTSEFFGYKYTKGLLVYSSTDDHVDLAFELKKKYLDVKLKIDSQNESFRRESIVYPILHEVIIGFTDVRMDLEHTVITDSELLYGDVDYFLYDTGGKKLLIVEAKKSDIEGNLAQLVPELIAVDKVEGDGKHLIFGSVTIGTVWQFAVLDSENKIIYLDNNQYSFPKEGEAIINLLFWDGS
ncbi:MAG: hypothetical protein GY862_29170 [Gammaproteobacteria bacterium]|nr:hypothetical protein [Gammaproteobacteria bacterium]